MTNLTKLAKSAVSLSCLPTLPCKFFLLNSHYAPNRYRLVKHSLIICYSFSRLIPAHSLSTGLEVSGFMFLNIFA